MTIAIYGTSGCCNHMPLDISPVAPLHNSVRSLLQVYTTLKHECSTCKELNNNSHVQQLQLHHWQHLLVVLDSTSISTFLNGQVIGHVQCQQSGGPCLELPSSIEIGPEVQQNAEHTSMHTHGDGGSNGHGSILVSQLAAWTSALTPEEAKQLSAMGSCSYTDASAWPQSGALLGLWVIRPQDLTVDTAVPDSASSSHSELPAASIELAAQPHVTAALASMHPGGPAALLHHPSFLPAPSHDMCTAGTQPLYALVLGDSTASSLHMADMLVLGADVGPDMGAAQRRMAQEVAGTTCHSTSLVVGLAVGLNLAVILAIGLAFYTVQLKSRLKATNNLVNTLVGDTKDARQRSRGKNGGQSGRVGRVCTHTHTPHC